MVIALRFIAILALAVGARKLLEIIFTPRITTLADESDIYLNDALFTRLSVQEVKA